MKFYKIMNFEPINVVDENKVLEIAESIKKNGYVGCPILVLESMGMLLTGSHRQAALNQLNENSDNDYEEIECAESVDDIINDYCQENDMTVDEIDFGNLGVIFEGTWVEEYKNEIAEW